MDICNLLCSFKLSVYIHIEDTYVLKYMAVMQVLTCIGLVADRDKPDFLFLFFTYIQDMLLKIVMLYYADP